MVSIGSRRSHPTCIVNDAERSFVYYDCWTSSVFSSQAQTQLEAKEEEQNFLREVSRFNADFSLRANGGVALASRAHGELLELQRELASLHEGLVRCGVVPVDGGCVTKTMPKKSGASV